MNKTVITVAILAAVGIGAYVMMQGDDAETMAPVAEAVEQQADTAAEAAKDVMEDAKDAAADAMDAAGDAASDAMDAAGDAASDAMDATKDAAAAAMDEAKDAAAGTADAVEDAAASAMDAAKDMVDGAESGMEEAADAAMGAAEGSAIDGLLTAETFDAGKIVTYIEGTELGPVKKQALITVVEKAADSPELVEAAISQVKAALNM